MIDARRRVRNLAGCKVALDRIKGATGGVGTQSRPRPKVRVLARVAPLRNTLGKLAAIGGSKILETMPVLGSTSLRSDSIMPASRLLWSDFPTWAVHKRDSEAASGLDGVVT